MTGLLRSSLHGVFGQKPQTGRGKPTRRLIITLILVLLTSCQSAPTTIATPSSLPIATQTTPLTTATTLPTPTPSATPVPPTLTPTPKPTSWLPQTDQVVLTILNEQEPTGRRGDPRPDWITWGAETFVIDPDGSGGYWIADVAAELKRLLHYSSQGILDKQIVVDESIVYVYDMVVTADAIWVLDMSSMTPKVIKLNLEGAILQSIEIPKELLMEQGQVVSNGLNDLWIDGNGNIMVSGFTGLFTLTDASGNLIAKPAEGLAYAGNVYKTGYDSISKRSMIIINDVTIQLEKFYYFYPMPFIGITEDGSFAVAVYVDISGGKNNRFDYLILYYTPSGALVGAARQWRSFISPEANHELAMDTQGNVYQLVSNEDRSVQIIRLGFTGDLAALPEPTPVLSSTPRPTVVPLQPAWETPPAGVSEQEKARQTLVLFFKNLYSKRFAEAASLFGGKYEDLYNVSERQEGEDDAIFWERVCHIYMCAPVIAVSDGDKVASDEYLFYVEFMDDMFGGRYETGACCGGSPARFPPVWQFPFQVKKIKGQWKVMNPPLWRP